ncbi:hypothetical protein BDZ94DRAFT_1322043 [Collybia nuda]|uniref:Uncharacterized protein n=1 Tax=Collybia nuda TaxID=64659 RepID=A0A9P5Y6J5_9AGAR|nr:hypothetical protein BDZ94DRAFT_1322043 [Collybia nuda]
MSRQWRFGPELASILRKLWGYNRHVRPYDLEAALSNTNPSLLPPPNLPDSESLAIPFWVAKDPKFWYSQIFNTTEAMAIAAQGKPDFLPSGHGRSSPLVPALGIESA